MFLRCLEITEPNSFWMTLSRVFLYKRNRYHQRRSLHHHSKNSQGFEKSFPFNLLTCFQLCLQLCPHFFQFDVIWEQFRVQEFSSVLQCISSTVLIEPQAKLFVGFWSFQLFRCFIFPREEKMSFDPCAPDFAAICMWLPQLICWWTLLGATLWERRSSVLQMRQTTNFFRGTKTRGYFSSIFNCIL